MTDRWQIHGVKMRDSEEKENKPEKAAASQETMERGRGCLRVGQSKATTWLFYWENVSVVQDMKSSLCQFYENVSVLNATELHP